MTDSITRRGRHAGPDPGEAMMAGTQAPRIRGSSSGTGPTAPPAVSPRPGRAAAGPLFAAVRAALHALGRAVDDRLDADLEGVARDQVAQDLRTTLTTMTARSCPDRTGPDRTGSVWSGPYGDAIAAVAAACADLDGGDLPGAYLALRAADTAHREAAHREAAHREAAHREAAHR